MQKTYLSVLLAGAMALSFGVQAAGESTISLGYAQSHVKVDDRNLDENPKGFNLKYRYEIDNNLGFITSFTYTTQSYDYYYGSNKVGDADLKYYSLTAGPAYRFNDYISAYGLIGFGHGKATSNVSLLGYSANSDESKTSVAYGAGLQLNVTPNIALDAHYEYSKLGDFKVGTWTVGAGYRF